MQNGLLQDKIGNNMTMSFFVCLFVSLEAVEFSSYMKCLQKTRLFSIISDFGSDWFQVLDIQENLQRIWKIRSANLILIPGVASQYSANRPIPLITGLGEILSRIFKKKLKLILRTSLFLGMILITSPALVCTDMLEPRASITSILSHLLHTTGINNEEDEIRFYSLTMLEMCKCTVVPMVVL